LRRRGHRLFGSDRSAQPVPEQSGCEEQRPREHELSFVARRDELEERVERQRRYSRATVELESPDACHDRVDDRTGPVVAVVSEQHPVRVQQPVVDTPGVDPDRVHAFRTTRGAHVVEDPSVKAQDVPAAVAIEADVPIPEPVHLGESEAILADLGDEHTPVRRAKVHRDDTCCRGARRAIGRELRTGPGHRQDTTEWRCPGDH
jgi:hypothetical protein